MADQIGCVQVFLQFFTNKKFQRSDLTGQADKQHFFALLKKFFDLFICALRTTLDIFRTSKLT